MTGIYGIENTVTGKWYVGQAVDLQKRWREHIRSLRKGVHKNAHLQSAWNKHGEKAFVFRLLEKCERDHLNDREMYWVKKLDSLENGYNNTAGGDGVLKLKMSEETRRKMSAAQTGKRKSSETIAKIKEARKTSEKAARHMKKLRDLKLARSVTEKERQHLIKINEPRRKPVLCIETGQVFKSAHDAAREIGTYQSNISKCCRDPQKTHRECHWRYINE